MSIRFGEKKLSWYTSYTTPTIYNVVFIDKNGKKFFLDNIINGNTKGNIFYSEELCISFSDLKYNSNVYKITSTSTSYDFDTYKWINTYTGVGYSYLYYDITISNLSGYDWYVVYKDFYNIEKNNTTDNSSSISNTKELLSCIKATSSLSAWAYQNDALNIKVPYLYDIYGFSCTTDNYYSDYLYESTDQKIAINSHLYYYPPSLYFKVKDSDGIDLSAGCLYDKVRLLYKNSEIITTGSLFKDSIAVYITVEENQYRYIENSTYKYNKVHISTNSILPISIGFTSLEGDASSQCIMKNTEVCSGVDLEAEILDYIETTKNGSTTCTNYPIYINNTEVYKTDVQEVYISKGDTTINIFKAQSEIDSGSSTDSTSGDSSGKYTTE